MIATPAILGALLAVGTFDQAFGAVAVALAFWALWLTRKQTPPMIGILLAGSIAATAPIAHDPWPPLMIAGLVLAVAVVGRHVRRNWSVDSFFVGLWVGVAVQVYAVFVTLGEQRPALLSLNASQVGQTGLMFWLILPELSKLKRIQAFIPASIFLAVSAARTPQIAALVYLVARPNRSRLIMFAVILLMFGGALFMQGNWDRLISTDGITTRIQHLADVEYSWFGVGVGNYVAATGLVRPHNVFVLLVAEMGVFALMPIFLLGWAVFTRRIPFSVFLSLFVLWQFTEEATGRIEGMFTTYVVLLAVWRPQASTLRKLWARSPTKPAW